MRVFGLWHGGNGYSLGDITSDCESWATLADAKRTLIERHDNGYWMRSDRSRVVNFDEDGVATLGTVADDLCPCVGDDTTIDLYPAERVGKGKWRIGDYPYACLSLGPRGGVRVESY